MEVLDVINDRQKDLQLDIPKSAIVVGCGGLGFWVAVGLCLVGVQKLTLIDGDKVEIHNLNRLLFPYAKIGTNKAIALSEILKSCRPDGDIIPIDRMCTIDLLDILWNRDAIIDCTDDYAGFQLPAYTWSKKKGAIYIRGGVTTDHITVTSSVPDWKFDGKREQCGVTIPAWIMPMFMTSALVIDKVVKTHDLEISKNIRN